MSRIIMLSGIIKGKATPCCFVGSPQLVAKNLCNVARGWAGCYAITIKLRREPAGRSRTMAVRLRLGRAYAKADALLMTMTAGGLTMAIADLRPHATGQPMADRGSVTRRSIHS